MKQLGSRQKKAGALVILAIVVALACGAIAVPIWLVNQHYDVALEDATSRLERYSKIVGTRDSLQKQVVEVKALEARRHFLKSASPALAAAELQEKAQSVFDANGAKVNSIQVLPHKDEGLYRQVTVQVQLIAALTAVKGMLHGLESAHPYLFIDNFSIRAPNMQVNRVESANEPELVVQFDLTGYALKGAP
nr:type II secretion system protein GspM [uncultured Rhodoferax sp.]